MQRQDLNTRAVSYRVTEEDIPVYEPGQETGATPAQIFVDKSQHVTNYIVNINATGEKSPELDTLPAMERTYIFESEIAKVLSGILDEIEDDLDDPTSFELKLSKFLSVLDQLHAIKAKREIHFSDLLAMLQMATVAIESNELKQSSISVLKEVVTSLTRKVNQETIKGLRHKLRENGINLLQPFRVDLDIRSTMSEIYPDETAT